MTQRRFPRGAPRERRNVDVPHTVSLVRDVPFLFEDAQLRANRRVMGCARQIFEHVVGRRSAALIQDVHDLPLAAREGGVVASGLRDGMLCL